MSQELLKCAVLTGDAALRAALKGVLQERCDLVQAVFDHKAPVGTVGASGLVGFEAAGPDDTRFPTSWGTGANR